MESDPIGLGGGSSTCGYANASPLLVHDPYGLFGLRDAAGFVPVLGSGLDAYDAFQCDRYGMALLNLGLEAVDLTGVGAVAKGLAVGTMKFASRKLSREAFKDTGNWAQMRRALQKANEIPTNSMATARGEWATKDHIFLKQRDGWPHEWLNWPPNLQTNVSQGLNSAFERMGALQRAMYLPAWMKTGAAGVASLGAGLFVDSGSSECGCE